MERIFEDWGSPLRKRHPAFGTVPPSQRSSSIYDFSKLELYMEELPEVCPAAEREDQQSEGRTRGRMEVFLGEREWSVHEWEVNQVLLTR